jgi:hypothetical protein
MTDQKKHWFKDLPSNQKKFVIGLFVVALITPIIIVKPFDKKVDPCKCAEFPGNIDLIGYDNLLAEDKKIFDACASKYRTASEAMDDCIEKVKK